MAQTLVRVFSNIAAAENARNELLNSGFDLSCVQLKAGEDEAGPVTGNFVLDYKDRGDGPKQGKLSKLLGLETRTDASDNHQIHWGNAILLEVETNGDPGRMEQADAILKNCDA